MEDFDALHIVAHQTSCVANTKYSSKNPYGLFQNRPQIQLVAARALRSILLRGDKRPHLIQFKCAR